MTRIDYFVLPWYKKIMFRVTEFFKALGMGIAHFFMSIPGALAGFFKKIGGGFAWLGRTFVHGGILTKLSYIVMGAGSLFRGQVIKGLMYLAAEVAYFGFMIDTGFGFLAGLRSLGTVQRGWHFDETLGIDVLQDGDNSMLILLYGIFALFITIVFLFLWVQNIHSADTAERLKKAGKKLPGFVDDIKELLDEHFHKTLLFIPVTGVVVFTIIPLVYMISLAFTNYDKILK